jgi:uncharacterized membrane protein YccC
MAHRSSWLASPSQKQWLVHSARTTLAAIVSLEAARLFRLPEAYWAAVTTLVVMQSTLGAALTVSAQRFAGTALGAACGALLAAYYGPSVIAFGAGLFLLGLACAALDLDRSAYRFAGVTLAIVMLLARAEPAWQIAIHRFIEVSIGIAVGLALTGLWPERQLPAAAAVASPHPLD